ncbi:MAG TPA: AsmA family protein, partial [Castellaniella sp.]|nr:AsmA family protein [Castellaniella sp.]
RSYAAQKINVQFNGRAGALDKALLGLRGNLAYQGQERTFSAANLELQVTGDVLGAHPIQGLKATLSAPQIRLDQRNTELKIDKLALRATGKAAQGAVELAFDAPALAISPESAQGEPVGGTFKVTGDDKIALAFSLEGLSGNANELRLRTISLDGGITQSQQLTQIKLTSPAVWDRSLRKGSLSAIKGDLSIRDPAAEGVVFEFPMIGSVHLDQVKDVLDVDINAVIDGAQLAFKSQTQRLSDPQTQFSLLADRLDLNHWMASPVAKAPAAVPAGGGGADEAAKKPAAPAAAPPAQPAAETRIDWSVLDGRDITGTIEVKDLRVRNVQLRDLTAATRLQKGKLQISKLSAKLYEGTLSGDLVANADKTLGVQLAVDKVALEPFLRALSNQGRISGTLGARIDLNARGDTVKAILASLAGRGTWKVADGAVHGIDASRSIQEASGLLRNALKGQIGALPSPFGENRRTAFSTFEGRIDFKDGQGKISKLALVSELIKVTEGKPASIDLPGQRLDLMLNAQITSRPPKALADAVGSLRGATLPVHISGPFDHLAYNIEWEAVRNQAIKEAVKSGLMNLVPEGIEIPKLPPASGAPAAAPSATRAKEPDPVKRIGDALKGLLSQ